MRTWFAVTVNYRTAALLQNCLASTGIPAERCVIVNNNDFRDVLEESSLAELENQGAHVLRPGGNPGFGEGVNQGIREAMLLGAERIIVLNPDVVCGPDLVERFDLLLNHSASTLLAPTIFSSDGNVWFDGGKYNRALTWAHHKRGHLDWLTGACLGFSVEALPSDGSLFPPGYFLYWEDVALGDAWRRAGGSLHISSVSATHIVGASQQALGAARKSESYAYYNCRNRLKFIRSTESLATRLWALVMSPFYIVRTLFIARPRDIASVRTLLMAALSGTFEGLRRQEGCQAT